MIFVCVASLSLLHRLDLVDRDQLSWWLAERQCDSGGLNGRPEKQADVCYSWWILSVLCLLGRTHWIDRERYGYYYYYYYYYLEERCERTDDGEGERMRE